jgi:hypothetical protein
MILFRQISWEQFAVLLGTVMLLYYAAVGWHYYKRELTALWQKEEPQTSDTSPVIMGASKAEEGRSEVASEELVFDVPEEQQEETAKKPQNRISPLLQQISSEHQAAMLGRVADVLEEIKTLLDMAKESGEAKENLLDTLQLLAPKLSAFSGTNYPDALTLYLLEEIRKRFPFEVGKADLEPFIHLTQKTTQ